MERTLVMVKPDGVQRALVGAVLGRLEARGLKFVGIKLLAFDRSLAEQFYGVHRGKPFFEKLVQYITSSPVVAAVVEGTDAVQIVRSTIGATSPKEAAPGTIRGDFALEIGRNLVHASDSLESAEREIGLLFEPSELVSWRRAADPWVFENA